jgi:hypothetical protein
LRVPCRLIVRPPVQLHQFFPGQLIGETAAHQTEPSLCSIFSIRNARRSAIAASASVLRVLAGFRSYWPDLKIQVAGFGLGV